MLARLSDLLPQIHEDEDHRFMAEAIKEACKAYRKDEVPVGAVIVHEGEVISKAHNLKERNKNPLHHAEVIAIQKAAKILGNWRLENTKLYVTLEPCPMCAGAIINARIPELIFSTKDPKSGACQSLYELLNDERLNHRSEVRCGIYKEIGSKLLKDFFREKRKKLKF